MTTIVGTAGHDRIGGTAGFDIIFGLDGDDTIEAGHGPSADIINGGPGSDIIQGFQGDDTIYADIDDEFVSGGPGDDLVVFEFASTEITEISGSSARDFVLSTVNGRVRLYDLEVFGFSDVRLNKEEMFSFLSSRGTDQDDTLIGSVEDDQIEGLDGADHISALSGDDLVHGGNGNDTILGADGSDEIAGDSGNDLVHGGAGRDWIGGGSENDTLHGDGGSDFIFGSWGSDHLYGGAGDDYLYGGTARDYLTPGSGKDRIYGDAGIDTAILEYASTDVSVAKIYTTGNFASANTIILRSPDGEEFFQDVEYFRFSDGQFRLQEVKQFKSESVGTSGNDVLFGSDAWNDVIFAWEGDDLIRLSGGPDTIGGWTGFDTIFASPSAEQGIWVNLETGDAHEIGRGAYFGSKLYSIEAAIGGAYHDHFTDSVEDNLFNGRGGNDYFLLSYGGADTVEGGDGVDTLYYKFATNAGDLHVSLMDERGYAGHAEGDVIRNIENLYGSFGDDTLVGDDADNLLDGYAGSNVLTGMGGDDTLIGSAYRDDIAVYSGTRDDYSIEQSTNAAYDFVVRHTAAGGTDGTDHLLNIDILRFTDGDLLL